MRVSQYLLATLKTTPKHCEIISHQLMLKAGLIRQVSSGLYIWLPTGLRILKNIKNIIRKEMEKIGAIELAMPIVQPAELWKKSGRWNEYGKELLRFKNRNNQDFILSPTHEEMVSELIHKEIKSCNEKFSLNVYQITTKYRDEIRPCFGIIRAREFIMKDGYSFHINKNSLQNTYDIMHNTYCAIFNKITLNFRIIQADTGKIGGILSHEFRAQCKCKEYHSSSTFTVADKNFYISQSTNTLTSVDKLISYEKKPMQLIQISNVNSITELMYKFNLSIKKIVKTIIVHTKNKRKDVPFSHKFIGLVIRADHQLDQKKVEMISQIHTPLSFANTEEICQMTGDIQPNLLGSINISIPLIIDCNVAIMKDFIAGSNMNDEYFFGINWNKDLPIPEIADLYEIQPSHNNITHNIIEKKSYRLSLNKFIEIGHIFQLRQKYSNIVHYKKNNYTNNTHINKNLILHMGCYGIGVTRIVAAVIEQNHDKNGIIWPDVLAPFKIAIIPINMYRSTNVQKTTEKIYNQLLSSIGNNILLYDQQEHPGVMFKDIDLIGIPHILIISDRNLINQNIEYKHRQTGITMKININMLMQFLIKKLND